LKTIALAAISILLVTTLIPLTLPQASAASTLYGIAKSGQGPSTLYSIDPTTGNSNLIGAIGFNGCSAMDFLGTVLYATCFNSNNIHVLITINTANGQGQEVGPTNIGNLNWDRNPGMSFNPSDNVLFAFFLNSNNFAIHDVGTININTGQASSIGASGVDGGGNGLAFTSDSTLYHARTFGSTSTLNTINQISGLSSTLHTVAWPTFGNTVFPIPNAMELDLSSGLIFASLGGTGSNARGLATIDPQTGVTNAIGITIDNLDSIAFLPMEQQVAGELLPLDNTALFLAGIQSMTVWMIPTVLGLAGVGVYLVKFRKQ